MALLATHIDRTEQPTDTPATSTTDLDERIKRAATESMTVHPIGVGMFEVYNVRGELYVVDLVSGGCTCPDFQYRNRTCKHQLRCEMHVGIREIPEKFGDCDARLMRESALRRAKEKRERVAARDYRNSASDRRTRLQKQENRDRMSERTPVLGELPG